MPRTRNDQAWEELFERYRILERVSRYGRFVIDSVQINEVRESRLMAKFDHRANLPRIFRANHLSILPISRSQYVIGPFETHASVEYDPDTDVMPMQLPGNLQSIDYTRLYSEAAALNCAYLAGMITDLIGEETYHTVSGRMSTESFNFSVANPDRGKPAENISVDNSQCEVDAGFEGMRSFVLVEAKNFAVDDFVIRQLYYPYRLWSRKLAKSVIPVLMTFSNDVFDFFVYRFVEEGFYNSLQLVERKRYAIAPEEITRADIDALLAHPNVVHDPSDVPFPQANSFDRVVDLLTILAERGTLSRDEITENYAFDARQTNYYTDAARYLGLVEKYERQVAPVSQASTAAKEIAYRLTGEAQVLMSQRHKVRYLELIRRILQHEVFRQVFMAGLQQGRVPDVTAISAIMEEGDIGLNETTRLRRAGTVRRWITWIWERIED